MGPARSQARRTALSLTLLAVATLAAAPPDTAERMRADVPAQAAASGADVADTADVTDAADVAEGADGAAASGTVTVSPDSVRPGGRVELRAHICEGATAVAQADAFDGDVELRPGVGGALFARATVRPDADAGPYTVTVNCEQGPDSGGTARGSFTVLGSGAAPASPSAPVRAGGGGMAGEPTEGGGFSAGGGAVLGLVAAAALGATVLRRHRATGRGPEDPGGSGSPGAVGGSDGTRGI